MGPYTQNTSANGFLFWCLFPTFMLTGDQEKELWPQSDYRSKFLGEQLSNRDMVTPRTGSFGGPPTITGDPRTQLGQFVTTNKSEFVGRYLPKQQIDPLLKVRIILSVNDIQYIIIHFKVGNTVTGHMHAWVGTMHCTKTSCTIFGDVSYCMYSIQSNFVLIPGTEQ